MKGPKSYKTHIKYQENKFFIGNVEIDECSSFWNFLFNINEIDRERMDKLGIKFPITLVESKKGRILKIEVPDNIFEDANT